MVNATPLREFLDEFQRQPDIARWLPAVRAELALLILDPDEEHTWSLIGGQLCIDGQPYGDVTDAR